MKKLLLNTAMIFLAFCCTHDLNAQQKLSADFNSSVNQLMQWAHEIKIKNKSVASESSLKFSSATTYQADSSYSWTWYPFLADWLIKYRTLNLYNINHFDSVNIGSIWNGNSWDNSYMSLSAYDANNNVTSFIFQTWINGNAWENASHDLNTYDANNNKTITVSQEWNGANWEDAYQYLNTFNANNQVTTRLSQIWIGIWENTSQSTYTYDINNYLVNVFIQSWNGSGWDTTSQMLNSYDANNNVISVVHQNWNGTGWNNGDQYLSTYDPNNNLVSGAFSTWNAGSASWDTLFRFFETYDSNNNDVSEITQNWDGTNWINADSVYIYYSQVLNFIPTLENPLLGFSFYPNPAGGTVTFNFGSTKSENCEVTFSDLMGRVINKQQLSVTEDEREYKLDISSLAPGIYLMNLKTTSGSKVMRVVKE
ncbi:MAG: T9SS type A sorting domain-containing protein [Bacteroidia bacterium]